MAHRPFQNVKRLPQLLAAGVFSQSSVFSFRPVRYSVKRRARRRLIAAPDPSRDDPASSRDHFLSFRNSFVFSERSCGNVWTKSGLLGYIERLRTILSATSCEESQGCPRKGCRRIDRPRLFAVLLPESLCETGSGLYFPKRKKLPLFTTTGALFEKIPAAEPSKNRRESEIRGGVERVPAQRERGGTQSYVMPSVSPLRSRRLTPNRYGCCQPKRPLIF